MPTRHLNISEMVPWGPFLDISILSLDGMHLWFLKISHLNTHKMEKDIQGKNDRSQNLEVSLSQKIVQTSNCVLSFPSQLLKTALVLPSLLRCPFIRQLVWLLNSSSTFSLRLNELNSFSLDISIALDNDGHFLSFEARLIREISRAQMLRFSVCLPSVFLEHSFLFPSHHVRPGSLAFSCCGSFSKVTHSMLSISGT